MRPQLCPVASLQPKGEKMDGMGELQGGWKKQWNHWSQSSGRQGFEEWGAAEAASLCQPGEEKAMDAGCCLPLHNQGTGPARTSSSRQCRGCRTSGHLHKIQQGQLGLHMGNNSSSRDVKSTRAGPARLGRCGKLSWAQPPAACSYCRVISDLKQPDEVTSRSPF